MAVGRTGCRYHGCMRAFSEMFRRLDETNKTNEKVAALEGYFRQAPAADAVWAVYFLSGSRPRQIVPRRQLAAWACELAGVDDWLFDESYQRVGDLAETITLILPPATAVSERPLSAWIQDRLLPLRGAAEDVQKPAVLAAWDELDETQRFLWNKLITGSFRVGVSQGLVARGLAAASGLERNVIAHRLMGHWEPTADFYEALLHPDTAAEDVSRPYPFFLASPLENGIATDRLAEQLGDVVGWQAEWKWDGIRCQVIRRGGHAFVWSRGEELIAEAFPEIARLAEALPDGTVLDGEIMPYRDEAVLPFAQLQRRIGRKKVGKKLLAQVPCVLIAYDLIEWAGADFRDVPLDRRRARLDGLVADLRAAGSGDVVPSPVVVGDSWEMLAELRGESRDRLVEGLMLKRSGSPYRVGRPRGDWWKWKIEPHTVDAVMIYAQRGSGKRSSLYTDYTFAVWDGAGADRRLTPFAKAYSGLTDKEIGKLDRWIRRHSTERFGPVRGVTPEQVFEIAFEGIQRSTRHKSGIAVRFPRILRWRHDLSPADADTLDHVRGLLPPIAQDAT